MSPQYVPAEKFEEERRALYASLLKPDSPSNTAEPLFDDGKDKSVEEVMAELHDGFEDGAPILTEEEPSVNNVAEILLFALSVLKMAFF